MNVFTWMKFYVVLLFEMIIFDIKNINAIYLHLLLF